MRIGELARQSRLSIHAIRWYETQRLIPGVKRNPSGHREYNDWHVGWLALLDRLKLTGMTISQMAAYTALVREGAGTLEKQRRMFVEHRGNAARDIAARQQALEHIDRKIEFLEQWLRSGTRPPIAQQLTPPVRQPATLTMQQPATMPVQQSATMPVQQPSSNGHTAATGAVPGRRAAAVRRASRPRPPF